MITFKFFVDKRGSLGNLKLRITNNRKSAQFSLGLQLDEMQLEDALSARPRPENMRWSRMLADWKRSLANLRADLFDSGRTGIDVKEIALLAREIICGENSSVVPERDIPITFGRYYRDCTSKRGNRSYRQSCEYTMAKMVAFAEVEGRSVDELAFEDVTLKWLNDFDDWLLKSGAAKNTRCIHFKNIRTVFNRAIDDEITEKYPFRRFKIRGEATRKRSLTVEELRKLFTMEVEPWQEFYRDMFKLIFMLCGINVVDLYNLKGISSEGRIEYQRAKTKRLYSVKVEPEAFEIIERYRGKSNLLSPADRWGDHRDFTRWLNSALKKLGTWEIIGRGGKIKRNPFWPEISSYWARHSWATVAYELDIPKDVIAQALGHGKSDVTEVYIRRDQRKVDDANRRVLDWILYGRR